MHEKKLAILLVEDNPADARLIELLLASRPHEPTIIRRAPTLADARAAIASGPLPDIILLDTGLPDAAPEETVGLVQAMAPTVPIVVLSGQSDESVAIRAVREGAQDYLVKGRIDSELLSRAVRYAMERKKAAEALRASEDRFQSFMSNSPAVAFIKDEQGRYIYVNALFERVFGLGEGGWKGKSDTDLWPPETAAALRRNDAAALHGNRPIEFQETIPGLDGPREWLSFKFPILGSDHRRLLAGMAVDTTARVRAEEALREAEAARLHAVRLQSETLNALPAHVALIDAEGNVLVVNESWQRFGAAQGMRDARFGVGSNYLDVSEQAAGESRDADLVAKGIRGVLAGDMPCFIHEYPCDGPDGRRWFRMHVSPILGRHQRGAVIMHLDISDRKAAEESLRHSEERHRMIVETAQEGIWLVDQNWRTTLVNARLCEMLGYSAEELIGRHLLDFMDDRGRMEAVELMRRREQGLSEYHQFRFLHKDGREVWVSASTSSIRDAATGFQGALAMLTDITERRRTEQALRDADDQLRQAQKMEAVGLLASGVAHDFNNLLTAIRGYASLARSSLYEDHPALESLDQVEEASRQAAGVAGALLTFARKTRAEKTPIRLATVVESAARLFRRTLPPGVTFVLETAGSDETWINGDETQLHQVVMNLALNARDAIDRPGRIRVRVVPAPPLAAGGPQRVSLIVSDTGCGMTPEVQARIFEPFFTTKARGRGTGLGLSVIHGIVQDHGGVISVDSKPGLGSTFTVTFPVVSSPPRSEGPLPSLVEGDKGARLAVVVQSSSLVRGVVASMLSTLGYDCVQAGTTGEAESLCASSARPASVLVADAQLADGTGTALLERMRQTSPRLRGVLVTDVLPPDEGAGNSYSVWLRKPFRVNDLQHALHRLAGRTASPAATPGENHE